MSVFAADETASCGVLGWGMQEAFLRTEMLLGSGAMERLRRSRVAVFGIGGVGGYVCEALARSGVGAFDLVDSDRVSITNLNRQIIATRKTIRQYKVDAMRERILEINPEAEIQVYRTFFLPENADEFPFGAYDYVVDAVDTVTAKLELILKARESGVPVISSMGAGNKLDASAFRVADIYETKVCPLAKVMRRELKKRGVESLKVVYSEEVPLSPEFCIDAEQGESGIMGLVPQKEDFENSGRGQAVAEDVAQECKSVSKKRIPGSVAFVPSVAGLILAGEVVKELIQNRG